MLVLSAGGNASSHADERAHPAGDEELSEQDRRDQRQHARNGEPRQMHAEVMRCLRERDVGRNTGVDNRVAGLRKSTVREDALDAVDALGGDRSGLSAGPNLLDDP